MALEGIVITAFYAGLIGILLLTLSVRVIRFRHQMQISLGAGNDKVMERRIRAQGNLVEYAPLTLGLLWMLETMGTPSILIHIGGVSLLAGRLMHAMALSSARPKPALRIGGMGITLTVLGFTSLGAITLAVVQLVQ